LSLDELFASLRKDRDMTGPGDSQPTEPPADVEPGVPASKSKPQTLREFETALRGLGFSRSEAKAISKGGFRAALTAEEEDESKQLGEDIAALIRRTAVLLKS